MLGPDADHRALIFVYGFILWTGWLSFTESRLLPRYEFAGLVQYIALFDNERWWTALQNLAIFGSLFITRLPGHRAAAGDPARSAHPRRRLPALDLPVPDGVVVHRHRHGVEVDPQSRAWGWSTWCGSGAWRLHLRLDRHAGDVDLHRGHRRRVAVVRLRHGAVSRRTARHRRLHHQSRASGWREPVRIYTSIIIPSLRPVFFSAIIILAHIAIKSFDLVMALTGGGPGFSSDLPATFMYTFAFNRNQIGLGAASAMMMLMTIIAVIVPMMYSELRRHRRG